jgi:hypothetical protein
MSSTFPSIEENGSNNYLWEHKTKGSQISMAYSSNLLSYSKNLCVEKYPIFLDVRLNGVRNPVAHSGTHSTVRNFAWNINMLVKLKQRESD